MKRREFVRTLLAAVSAGTLAPRAFAARQRFKKFGKIESEHFDVVRMSESVFAVRGKPNTGIPTNSSIIVGEGGVAVVDTHLRPSLDLEMIGIVKRITDQPIQYLINTHWHQDHTLGNQAFEGKATTIIAHENTRNDLLDRVVSNVELQRQVLPEQLSQAREVLRAQKMSGEELKQLALEIELDEGFLKELKDLHIVPPSRVFKDSYRLDIADQPIELRHLGFGHTHGDIVIHLPQEKTIVLGDLVTNGQPFMRRRDAVPSQWGPTLRKIAALSWDNGIIGHGWVESARDRLEIEARFLEVLVLRVTEAIAAAVPGPDVPKAVLPLLMEFAPQFPYFEQAVIENIERTSEELRPKG